MSEELARIKEVGFGNRDVGRPVLFFTAELESGTCALQILEAEQALELIKQSGVYEVERLNGVFCWVEKGRGVATYKRIWGGPIPPDFPEVSP